MIAENSVFDCYLCTKEYAGNPFIFSCGHHACLDCLCKRVFLQIQQIKDCDTMKIGCKCKTGWTELSLSVIDNSIKDAQANKGKKEDLCKKHHQIIKLYCIQCEKSLCSRCIESHSELFTKHNMSEEKPIEIGRCKIHKDGLNEIYCKNCRMKVCYFCVLKGASHYTHNFLLADDFAQKLKDALRTIPLKYPTYDDLSFHINEIESSFKSQVNVAFSSICDNLDSLIQQLRLLKEKYQENWKKMLERGAVTMNIIKLLYFSFYQDIAKCERLPNIDISHLKFLNKIHCEFEDVQFTFNQVIQESLNKIIATVDDFSNINNICNSQYYFIQFIRPFQSVNTLNQHTNCIRALIQLQNGSLASCSDDKTIRIWDSKKGFTCTKILREHSDWVRALLQLEDGRIVSGSDDRTIKIWENVGGEYSCTYTLNEHSDYIRSLVQLTDGRIISGSRDRTIKIWDTMSNFSCIDTLKEHTNSVSSVIQLHDGRLASGSDDKLIKIWSPNETTFICTQTLNLHSDYVNCLIQLKDGRLVSGSDDRSIIIWDTHEKNNISCLRILNEHTNSIRALLELKDGRMASGSFNTIKIFDIQNRFTCTHAINGHNNIVICLLQLKDQRIASASRDTTIKIWSEQKKYYKLVDE